jgi:hypothetical protein
MVWTFPTRIGSVGLYSGRCSSISSTFNFCSLPHLFDINEDLICVINRSPFLVWNELGNHLKRRVRRPSTLTPVTFVPVLVPNGLFRYESGKNGVCLKEDDGNVFDDLQHRS